MTTDADRIRKAADADFRAWYKRCDALCLDISGVGIEDLADGASRAAFDDGYSPIEYVRQQLEEEGFPFGDEATEERTGRRQQRGRGGITHVRSH